MYKLTRKILPRLRLPRATLYAREHGWNTGSERASGR